MYANRLLINDGDALLAGEQARAHQAHRRARRRPGSRGNWRENACSRGHACRRIVTPPPDRAGLQRISWVAGSRVTIQIRLDQAKLFQRGLQVLDDLRRDDPGLGQIIGILQRCVPEPEDIEAGLSLVTSSS
jgi:hypothetical protein